MTAVEPGAPSRVTSLDPGTPVRVLVGPHAGMAATVDRCRPWGDPYDAGLVLCRYETAEGWSGTVRAEHLEPAAEAGKTTEG